MRVELGLEPEQLDNETWANRFAEWVYVQGIKGKMQEKNLLQVIKRAFGSERTQNDVQ